MADIAEKSTGLFDKLYSAGKEVIDAAKKPLIKKSIKRKLHSAHDDAEDKINQAEIILQNLRSDFQKYDVNKILEEQAKIAKLKGLQKDIQAEYRELFSKEMPLSDED